ncbi:uncharacterized protein LY79DRAFT_575139 [Colletotrichum navitas]|uniref:Uncharacterized protein n=1 Tax=Colletotrichum navitas TaxID=681940 RepID=A0AAD8VBW6_9PEZI|nr:uncharacterized protein LY79DRAFT_575139 [Colletotrichum navitas]KAK1599436.1 hypothetical protein LY79DRAFT_575139 [Colletotrichum navitas]
MTLKTSSPGTGSIGWKSNDFGEVGKADYVRPVEDWRSGRTFASASNGPFSRVTTTALAAVASVAYLAVCAYWCGLPRNSPIGSRTEDFMSDRQLTEGNADATIRFGSSLSKHYVHREVLVPSSALTSVWW